MKTLSLLCLLFSITLHAQDDSMASGQMPRFYKPRDKAVLNIALIYYGDYYRAEDLARVQVMFEKRFFEATGNALKLNTVFKAILPFKHKLSDYPDFREEFVTAPDRLQRMLYYKLRGMGVGKDIYDAVVENPEYSKKLSSVDAIVAVTGAQFEGLGFASGRVAVTENPMEIAWGSKDGGTVEYVTDERVVDGLIHETGHILGLDHASKQCHQDGMDYKAMRECCKTSPSKDDVLSYCRDRSNVRGSFFYGFKECHRKNLNEKVIPAMLRGEKWMGEQLADCE